MDLELSARVAFVAGGSRGIGKAIARRLVLEGAQVAVAARTKATLDSSVLELAGLSTRDNQVIAYQGDLTDIASVDRAVRTVSERWRAPDIVIANVGTGRGPRGWDASDEAWHLALQANLLCSVQLARAFLPGMIARGSGVIVLISSITGVEATPAPLPYSAAKAALVNYAKNLARDVGQHGVRVNVVAPGNIMFDGGSWAERLSANPEAVTTMLRSEVPLRRFGGVEEIADVVAFVASDRASFMTGSCIVVDGGQTRSY